MGIVAKSRIMPRSIIDQFDFLEVSLPCNEILDSQLLILQNLDDR